jgi:K+:H+ antiporter
MSSPCSHLNFVVTDSPNTAGCEECLARGGTWVQLRICRTCGHVGCCDASKNKHATKHFRDTHHPIVTVVGPGDRSWCYVDEVAIDLH